MRSSPTAEQVADALLRSRRYAAIARTVVLRIADRELQAAQGSLEEAVKRSKRRLHQVHGAFMPRSPRYERWVSDLEAARAEPQRLRAAARAILGEHASTRERARDLRGFYGELFSRVAPPRRLLDAGCGLHPLAVPWMELAADATYFACDIDEALLAFVRTALAALGVSADVFVADLSAPPRFPEADLALLLKTLPCLEVQQGTSALDLIDALPAPVVAVSFPAHSLGGGRRCMGKHHAVRFERAAAERGWSGESFEAAGELVFLVRGHAAAAAHSSRAPDAQPDARRSAE